MAAGSNCGADCEGADGAFGDATDAIAFVTRATGGDALATSVAGTAEDGLDAATASVATGAGEARTATSDSTVWLLGGKDFGLAARISGGSSAAGPLTGFDGTANSSGTPR